MSRKDKQHVTNLQPWYGEAQLLITVAGEVISYDDYEDIQEVLREKLQIKYGERLINVEILPDEGVWGDPDDLL